MKKVSFKGYRQYASLFNGSFMILTASLTGVFLYMYLGTIFIPEALVMAVYLLIGIVLVTGYVKNDDGIKAINIDESNIIIKTIDGVTKKESIITIPKSDILSCKVKLKCNADYSTEFIKRKIADILINFSIFCENDKNYEINFHTCDNLKIKRIFSVAKYFPNFSYEIETNSQEWQESIINIAKTGKELSIIKYYKTYFSNPNIPDSTKKRTKQSLLFTLFAIIFFFCLLIITQH